MAPETIKVQMSPKAKKIMTKKRTQQLITTLVDHCESKPDWKPGKSYETPFNFCNDLEQHTLTAALDYLKDGTYQLLIGKTSEIESVPND